jgi:hypothetical protein
MTKKNSDLRLSLGRVIKDLIGRVVKDFSFLRPIFTTPPRTLGRVFKKCKPNE